VPVPAAAIVSRSGGCGRPVAGGGASIGGTLAPLPLPAVSVEPFEKLSVFFPMWNEEDYIERAVDAAATECRLLVERGEIRDYELIVVDDASTDATPQIADRLAAADPHVRVVHHPVNRKLGGSMKTGFASATGDLVLYTDADLPFDMAEVAQAVRLIRYYQADIVSAYRFDRTGEGASRAVYTFFYNVLIRRLFGVRLRDINFAFKLCRSYVFDHVQLQSEGSFIDAELIIRAKRLGYEVIQFGVDYFPRTRGTSTLASLGVIRTILREMWQLRGELRRLTPIPTEQLRR
jgi:glycosyltransferase involved in cell wall biosynthesis